MRQVSLSYARKVKFTFIVPVGVGPVEKPPSISNRAKLRHGVESETVFDKPLVYGNHRQGLFDSFADPWLFSALQLDKSLANSTRDTFRYTW